MASARVRTAVSAVIGAAVGYLVWLGATAIIAATAPVRYWVVSDTILLIALTSVSVLLAVRNKHTVKATAFWAVPILPIVVSVYVLVVVIT